MSDALIEELLVIYGYPTKRRDEGVLKSRLPELLRRTESAGFGGDLSRQVERLLVAGCRRIEPPHLQAAAAALWALPPHTHLATAGARERIAAELWLRDYAKAEPSEKSLARSREPVSANTLRSERHRRYFARALAEGLDRVAADRAAEQAETYTRKEEADRYRPKMPAAVTLELKMWSWLDDYGRRLRTITELTTQAMMPTQGLHRLLVTSNWKGYARKVRALDGCEIAGDEPINDTYSRLALSIPALKPGERHTHRFEQYSEYDDNAPMPTGGILFADEGNDDFVARLVVYFGDRRPRQAWYFPDMPRPLVPGAYSTKYALALDPEHRLVRNFFPPTNARKCYGIAWTF